MTNAVKITLLALGLMFATIALLAALRSADNRHLERHWRTLDVAPRVQVFHPSMIEDLPGPARRYFEHTIAPGTRLASTVRLRMSGYMHTPNTPRPMHVVASEIVTPGAGYVWEGRVRIGVGFLSTSDYYVDGRSRIRLVYMGLLPLHTDTTSGAARSAIGRLVIESLWCPSALLPQRGVVWERVDDERARAIVMIDGLATPLIIRVDSAGRLKEAIVYRMDAAHPDAPRFIPFGFTVLDERTIDGYTIPTHIKAGWHHGSALYEQTSEIFIDEAWFK